MEAIEQVFRALSDPTRLRVVNLLRTGEMCVGDLVEVLDVSQPLASRHLAYLRRVGLVIARREGLWVFYSLFEPSNEMQRSLLETLETCALGTPSLRQDSRRAARLRQVGGCCPELTKAGGRSCGTRKAKGKPKPKRRAQVAR